MRPMNERDRREYDRQENDYVMAFNRGLVARGPPVVHPVYVSDGTKWVRKEEYEARKLLQKPKRRKRRKSA